MNLDNIKIKDGVAHVTIDISDSLKRKDIAALLGHARDSGATKAIVESAKLADEGLERVLRYLADKGGKLHGGRVVPSTNPTSDFTLIFDQL